MLRYFALVIACGAFSFLGCGGEGKSKVQPLGGGGESKPTISKEFPKPSDSDEEYPIVLKRWVEAFVADQKASPQAYSEFDFAKFPSAKAAMVVPQYFVKGERFDGFHNVGDKSRIRITATPVPFRSDVGRYIRGLAKEATRLYKASYTVPLEVSGMRGQYLFFVKLENKLPVVYQYLAFGREEMSWVIVASHPIQGSESKEKITESVIKSLLSTKIIDDQATDDDTGFALASEKMKVKPGFSKAIVFTKDGEYPVEDKAEPFYKATPSIDYVSVERSQQARFAKARFQPSPEMVVQKIISQEEITVNGLPCQELIGIARDKSTDQDVILYLAMVFENNAYYELRAWTGYKYQDYEDEFKKITRSFALTQ